MRIREGVKQGARFVLIDTLNGYLNAMPGEKYLNSQLHELTSFLNQQGIVTVLVLAQQGLVSAAESPLDLSYLADMVVHLRYFEAGGDVHKALAVIKKRTGAHETTIRELLMQSGTGIRVGPPLVDFDGVLSGAPKFRGSPRDILSSSKLPSERFVARSAP